AANAVRRAHAQLLESQELLAVRPVRSYPGVGAEGDRDPAVDRPANALSVVLCDCASLFRGEGRHAARLRVPDHPARGDERGNQRAITVLEQPAGLVVDPDAVL